MNLLDQGPFAIIGVFCILAVWFYYSWYRAILTFRDPNSTEKVKYGFVFAIFGVLLPIFVFYMMNANGNANSNNTGGNAPPLNTLAPTPAGEAAGGTAAVVNGVKPAV